MPYDAVFDASKVAPKQGGGGHPVGNKFPFRITSTDITPTKDNKGGMFAVEFTSDVGSIINRYNLWNESEAARRIANEQLSALCHAVGIFQVDFKNDGAALRGAQGLMDIGFQKGHEPSAEKPEGGYVELKKVYDKMGNEPGKAPVNQGQPNAQQGAWGGNAAPQNQVAPQTAQQGQGSPQVQSGFNPNPAQNNAHAFNSGGSVGQAQPSQSGGWQQGAGDVKPPWG